MDHQEKVAMEFFEEHQRMEQQQQQQAQAGAVSASSSARHSSAKEKAPIVIDDTHITMHDAQVHCNLLPEKLTVLSELRVDFENMRANGFDLWEEVVFQGWEYYFARLHGPVYTHLVKDFWKQAEADNYYIVSHVLGKKVVITERNIAQLLGLEHRAGIRIVGRDNKSPFVRGKVNPEIFQASDCINI